MDFGGILTKAWKIIWKFKVLWIFGILTSCGQGSGGGGSGGGSNSGSSYSGSGDFQVPPGVEQFFYNIENFFDSIQGWQIALFVAGTILFVLLLTFLFTALGTIGRIGLIQGTIKAEAGAERLTFGELFNEGKPYFWRVLIFNFLAGLVIFLGILILMVPLIGMTVVTLGIGLLCLLPLICILIPVGWLVSILIEQANIAIVVEDLGMVDGAKHGWEVFRANIGNMAVMGLILVIGGGIVNFIISLPILFTMVPIILGAVASGVGESASFAGGGLLVSALCCVSYLPVLILLSGILQAYIKTAWTLTYLQLQNGVAIVEEIDNYEGIQLEETSGSFENQF